MVHGIMNIEKFDLDYMGIDINFIGIEAVFTELFPFFISSSMAPMIWSMPS